MENLNLSLPKKMSFKNYYNYNLTYSALPNAIFNGLKHKSSSILLLSNNSGQIIGLLSHLVNLPYLSTPTSFKADSFNRFKVVTQAESAAIMKIPSVAGPHNQFA